MIIHSQYFASQSNSEMNLLTAASCVKFKLVANRHLENTRIRNCLEKLFEEQEMKEQLKVTRLGFDF